MFLLKTNVDDKNIFLYWHYKISSKYNFEDKFEYPSINI